MMLKKDENITLPSPMERLNSSFLNAKQVEVWVKREDKIHTKISGNKWRKLKYNLEAALASQVDTIRTFGGAYSNHIAAVAAAGVMFNLKTEAIIRGERPPALNPTLRYAKKQGMQLRFVSRKQYAELKLNPDVGVAFSKERNVYIVPEGGTNCLALKGCKEIIEELRLQLPYKKPQYICTACGTGGTMGGLIAAATGDTHVLGVSVLKGGFMRNTVSGFINQCGEAAADNWEIDESNHFGGYAKFNAQLIDFINDFYENYQIPLDPIYTGKLFYAVFEKIKRGYFPADSRIVLLHTGGLQGAYGFNERFGNLIRWPEKWPPEQSGII